MVTPLMNVVQCHSNIKLTCVAWCTCCELLVYITGHPSIVSLGLVLIYWNVVSIGNVEHDHLTCMIQVSFVRFDMDCNHNSTC